MFFIAFLNLLIFYADYYFLIENITNTGVLHVEHIIIDIKSWEPDVAPGSIQCYMTKAICAILSLEFAHLRSLATNQKG